MKYVLSQIKGDHYYNYAFTIIKTAPASSCHWRFGCTAEGEVLLRDKLKMDDLQGTGIFESKRNTVVMENIDDVYYYTKVDGKTKLTMLTCKEASF